MGNIPLQNGGQFINPTQKRGVSADWGNQAFEHAKSITESFNKAGQEVGNMLIKQGKFIGSYGQAQEQENTQNDAYSLSMYKLKLGEGFSEVEETIKGKDYKTVEEFDADWEQNIAPQMASRNETVLNDGDVIWNRSRLEQQTQRAFSLASETFRIKQRKAVGLKIGERRKSNAAQEISRAGASANIGDIYTARDAAITAGISPEEVQEMTTGALFEAFSVTQRQAMEAHGGVNSAGYKIAMHKALSAARDNIAGHIREILNAEDEAIYDAWVKNDFSDVLESPKKKGKTGLSLGASGKKSSEDKSEKTQFGRDLNEAREQGLQASKAVLDESLTQIDAAVKDGTITPEQAQAWRDEAYARKQEADRQVDAAILASREASNKEQRDISKELIRLAATDEAAFLQFGTSVQYSGEAATEWNEKLDWMRERPESEYNAQESSAALLRIYANAGRFTDESDKDGSYRLSALALARKHCNAADYAKAVSFLAGGEKDSASQKLIENGMAKLFEAAGLDRDEMDTAHLEEGEDGLLAAYCGEVLQIAGMLPPAAFRVEVDALCESIKKYESKARRIRMMEDYVESLTRDIPSLEELRIQGTKFESFHAEVEKELTRASEEQKKQEVREKERKTQEKANRFTAKPPNIVIPGAVPFH